MNKLFLMKNPDIFQGQIYLNKNKKYFEGWYFKNTYNGNSISFIPGININEKNKKAFIQVITDTSSYFVNYDINNFDFSLEPFYIQIGRNFFSKRRIHIDIKDKTQNIDIYGEIKYSNSRNINTSFFCPNIMGPFSYVPFMECNHAILSMQNNANGSISINNTKFNLNNGLGYIEKDWGCSFPKSYIWCQGNNFQKSDVSFMLSIADIPFKLFNFRGIICVLKIASKEFKFATYNNAKLLKYDVNINSLNITLKKNSYYLNIKSIYDIAHKLSAPVNGKMEKDIFESISATINITLKKNDEIIFSDRSTNCGLEIVKNYPKCLFK